jgi:hypothetical protein
MGQREQPPESRGEFHFTQGAASDNTGATGEAFTGMGLPGVSPAVSKYAQRQLPKQAMPLGSVPMPPIPALAQKLPLDSPPQTMSAYAEAMGRVPTGTVTPVGGGIIQPGSVAATSGPVNVHDYDIRPTDMLPPAAMQDPECQQGTGAAFAVSQPHLALRYGVIRNGVPVSPRDLNLKNPKRGLSSETLAGLNAISQASQDSTLGHKAIAAAAPPLPAPAEPTLANEAAQKAIDEADPFQVQSWMRQLRTDDLNNAKQRELIESRIKPITIDELITFGYCEQRIPIVPVKFEITLRSTDPETELALKRLAMEDARSVNATDEYYLDRYSYYGIVAALVKVNDRILPPYRDQATGNFSDELFKVKAQNVLRLPMHMVASIGVQVGWFDQRVRKLFRVEDLGNG